MAFTFITLIGQILALAVLVWFVRRFVWKPLNRAIEERQSVIAKGVAAAGESERSLKEAAAKSDVVFKSARQDSARIVADARKDAQKILSDAKSGVEAEVARMREKLVHELELSMQQQKKSIEDEVTLLVKEGVEAILKREIKREDHEKLFDELSASIRNKEVWVK